jgi:hypothetical protein
MLAEVVGWWGILGQKESWVHRQLQWELLLSKVVVEEASSTSEPMCIVLRHLETYSSIWTQDAQGPYWH